MPGFAMLGFISLRHYTTDDSEMLAVIESTSAEALAAWRDHPDHHKVQQRGHNDFYAMSTSRLRNSTIRSTLAAGLS